MMPPRPEGEGHEGPATISEVAERAGVSRATVSRVLNGAKRVSPETRRRVERVIKELDYRVNPHARGLRTSRANAVALLLTSGSEMLFEDPNMATLMRATSRALDARGWAQMVLVAGSRAEQNRALQIILAGYVDGVMLVNAHAGIKPLLSVLAHRRVPLVACGLPHGLEGRACSVEANAEYGGALAAVHLEDLGCTNLAVIGGPDMLPDSDDRMGGFMRAVTTAAPQYVLGDYSITSGRDCMAELLERGHPIDGVFACNDAMALGAMQVLAERGLAVPDDVKVIGYDDSPFASQCEPPLTTLRQDFDRTADEMVRVLENQIAGQPVERVLLNTALVIRGTTVPAHT